MATSKARMVGIVAATVMIVGGGAAAAVALIPSTPGAPKADCTQVRAQVDQFVRNSEKAGSERDALLNSADSGSPSTKAQEDTLERTTSEQNLYANALALSAPTCYSTAELRDARGAVAATITRLNRG